MKNRFTKKEVLALNRLRKTLESIPNNLCVYIVDAEIVICKVGVPSVEIQESVGFADNAGVMLTDLHDDHNYGKDYRRSQNA